MAHDVLSDAHRPSRPSRRSVCRALSFSCMVLLALLGAAWSLQSRLLQELASIWIIEERPRQADAIVVLGGSVDVRVTKAAELWRQGFAPLILLAKTRSAAGEAEPGELTHARSLLSGLGVPYSAVRAFGHDVVNTYEEACALRLHLRCGICAGLVAVCRL